MRLYVLSNYKNRELSFSEGDVINDASPELVDYLMADAPGCFSKQKPKAKAPDAPVKDKAVSRAPAKKKITKDE